MNTIPGHLVFPIPYHRSVDQLGDPSFLGKMNGIGFTTKICFVKFGVPKGT